MRSMPTVLSVVCAAGVSAPAAAAIDPDRDAEFENFADEGVDDEVEAPLVQEPKAELRAIFARPEFGREEVRLVWRAKTRDDLQPDDPPENPLGVGRWVGIALAWGLGMGGALALYLLISAMWRGRGPGAPTGARAGIPPASLFGLDLRPDSLPADIAAAALEAWAAGDARRALSLLYRGALVVITQRLRVEVASSATEGECVALVREAVAGPVGADFAVLTRHWLRTAYGDRPPATPEFQALVDVWRTHHREIR